MNDSVDVLVEVGSVYVSVAVSIAVGKVNVSVAVAVVVGNVYISVTVSDRVGSVSVSVSVGGEYMYVTFTSNPAYVVAFGFAASMVPVMSVIVVLLRLLNVISAPVVRVEKRSSTSLFVLLL